MIINSSSLSFAFQSSQPPSKANKNAKNTSIPSPLPRLALQEDNAESQPWDPSDPNNMHALSLSDVPEKWRPKAVGDDVEDRYRDIIILVAVVFLTGALLIFMAAMSKCMYNHECCWQSEGCWGERKRRKEEKRRKRREEKRLADERKRSSLLSMAPSYREYVDVEGK